MKRFIALALSCFIMSGALAVGQGTSTTVKTTTKTVSRKAATASAADVEELKRAVAAQQQQIQQLRQELQTRDQAVRQLEQRLDQSQAAATQAQQKADQASTQASAQEQSVSTLKTDVADLRQNVTNTALSLQEEQKQVAEATTSPLALHYKGVTITPGGFLAAETVYRQRGLAADVNTPFNSVNLPGASQNHLSEFFASGRQSRVSMLAEGKLKSAKLTGYVEGDFLSAGVTSNNNQSNSYTFRQRQAWGQASVSGWNFTGGQMWSLITETKKGLDNRTEALPMTIDAQYTAGFSWARQYGFRMTKDFGDKVWVGFSVENPQTILTTHGNPTGTTASATATPGSVPGTAPTPNSTNFLVGAAGTSGGLYNPAATYSFNYTPDFVAKAAFEPGFGHYEVFGVVSNFRDRIFPCGAIGQTDICGGVAGASASGAYNNTATGGGVGAHARVSAFNKHVDLGVHFLGGNGIGRYGTTGLPDATVRADGVLQLLRSYQALGTLEWHSPKIDIYLNGGGEYVSRGWTIASKKGVGYGSPLFANSGCFSEPVSTVGTAGQFPVSTTGFLPGSLGSKCTGDTRNIIEGTFGFWYKIYNGPKGRIQLGPQYSYVVRNTWSGVGGEPHGIENMAFTSFRYYLP
ncbi:MAG TPA: hypothetical protein VFJ47_15410 [Terriglobales bacterium]|nr:hypothetical protein [Terriglobales bacterium]